MAENTTVTLPSGAVAEIRPGKGRDLMMAQRMAKNESEIGWGLMAKLVTIDGKKKVLEDYLDMDLADVLVLQAEVVGKSVASRAPSTSSTSPTTPDGDSENLESST